MGNRKTFQLLQKKHFSFSISPIGSLTLAQCWRAFHKIIASNVTSRDKDYGKCVLAGSSATKAKYTHWMQKYMFSVWFSRSDNSSSAFSRKAAPASVLISKSIIYVRSIFYAHPCSKAIISENIMTVCQEPFLNFLHSLWRLLQNMESINYSSGSHVIADYNVAI